MKENYFKTEFNIVSLETPKLLFGMKWNFVHVCQEPR